MISYSRARVLTLPALALAGVVMFCMTGVRARADAWDKKTILTVDQPIQVRNTYLEPGTYVFKLMNSNSDRHIVQIFNSDQSRIIDTVLAIPNYRLQPTGDSRFAFWETPPGTAKAMRAWFYPGDNFGQEFPYPKNLRQLEVAAVVSRTEPAPAFADNTPTAEAETKAEAAAASPTPAPQPAAENTPQPVQQSEPVVIAQNSPAASPDPAPAAAEAPQTPSTSELPKTGSPYPGLALIGLASLLSYAVLRK